MRSRRATRHGRACERDGGTGSWFRDARTFVVATAAAVAFAGAPSALAAKPIIKSIAPAGGPSAGDTQALISGEHLLPLAVQKCGPCAGVAADFASSSASIVSGTQRQLKVLTPAHAPGAAEVTVTTPQGTSEPSRYTYVAPPRVDVETPLPGSVNRGSSLTVAGAAVDEADGSTSVTIRLSTGSPSGPVLESHVVPASGGRFSTLFGALPPGAYAVRAEARDEFGVVGVSAPLTFSMVSEPLAGDLPPVASFTWIPAAPRTAETVSFVSSSRDAFSPITAFAWALTGEAPFAPGGAIMSTSFSTPGTHVVRLRVASADGLSAVASEAVDVSGLPLPLMQPFPVVRIIGSYGASGVKVAVLSVAAPPGAHILVRCGGRGCPARFARRITPSSRRGLAVMRFSRFQRRLPVGVVLAVRVYERGEIGKYTRFVIRRGRFPKRVDTCIGPSGGGPIACPQ